jgi:hypothetical protein
MLLGLSGAQLGLVGSALVVVVAAGMASGPAGLLVAAPIWAGALALALVPVGGRPLIEILPILGPWVARRSTGAHVELATTKPVEHLRIPGVRGRLRVTADPDTGAALIQGSRARASTGPVSAVVRVRGRGFLLEDAAAQDRRVAGWGRLLGSLAQVPGVNGVQVLHRTSGGGGGDVRRWWSEQSGPGAGWAHRILAELSDDTAGATTVECLIGVSLRPRRGVEISTVLASLGGAMEAAELDGVTWLTPRQVVEGMAAAYDPTPATGSPGSGSWSGPMGVAEAWSHARSDSAFHATYWVAEWPRSATHPGFLRPILLAPGGRRTFSLIAESLPTGKALKEIRRARAEQMADAGTRARVGRVEDEASRAAAAELTRREEDLIAGHGDLRFVGLVAVSAASLSELKDACGSVESAAAQAGCELRRLVGQQVQAYAAAALPLARVLS